MDPLKALLIEQKAQYEETYFASSKEWIDASEVEHNKLIESAKSVYTQLMSSVAPLSTDQLLQVTNALHNVRNTQGESQGDPQRTEEEEEETRARSSQQDTQQTEQTTEARTGQESEGPLTRAQQEALGTPQRSGLGTGQEAHL